MRKGLLGAQLPFWGWGCMATGPLGPQAREGGVGVRVTTARRPARPLGDPQSPVPPSLSVVSSSLSLTLTCAEEQPGAFLRVFSPGERRRHSGGRGRLVACAWPVRSPACLAPAAAQPPCFWLSSPLVGRQ